jgi:hypothetical protein
VELQVAWAAVAVEGWALPVAVAWVTLVVAWVVPVAVWVVPVAVEGWALPVAVAWVTPVVAWAKVWRWAVDLLERGELATWLR